MRDGALIRAKWEAVVSQTRYEVAALEELKALWQAIVKTGRAKVFLDTGEPRKPGA